MSRLVYFTNIISSIAHKKSSRFQMKINEVSSAFKDLCVINGFKSIDNANINNSDIHDNVLHLKYSGTYKLVNNFINEFTVSKTS